MTSFEQLLVYYNYFELKKINLSFKVKINLKFRLKNYVSVELKRF